MFVSQVQWPEAVACSQGSFALLVRYGMLALPRVLLAQGLLRETLAVLTWWGVGHLVSMDGFTSLLRERRNTVDAGPGSIC